MTDDYETDCHAVAASLRENMAMNDHLLGQAETVGVDGWRTTEPPKDGTPIYIRVVQPYRFLPYKANSQQFKRGEKGRWQVMNEYGGWENSHPLGNEWRIDSPFSNKTKDTP